MQSILKSSKKIFQEDVTFISKNYEHFKTWCKEVSNNFIYFNKLPQFIMLLYLILGNELDLLGHHNADETYRVVSFWGEFGKNLNKNPFKKTLQRIAALVLFTITSCIILIAAIYFIPHKIYKQKLFEDSIINNKYLRIIITIISIPLGPLIYLIIDGAYKTLGALLSWVAQIILSPFFLIISFIYEMMKIISESSNITRDLLQNIFKNIKCLIKFSLIMYIPLASISLCFGASHILAPTYILTNILLGHFLTIPNQIFFINYVLVNSNFIFLWYKHNPQIFNRDNLKQFTPLYIFTFLLLTFSATHSNSLFIFLSSLNQLFIYYKNNNTPKENIEYKPISAFILDIIEANPQNIEDQDIKNIVTEANPQNVEDQDIKNIVTEATPQNVEAQETKNIEAHSTNHSNSLLPQLIITPHSPIYEYILNIIKATQTIEDQNIENSYKR